MTSESNLGIDVTNLILQSPLYTSILREWTWLNNSITSRKVLDGIIENNQVQDLSILRSIKSSGGSIIEKNKQIKSPSTKHNKQLKLYSDLQWSIKSEYYWPIKIGDYSPLSPDADTLERHGKIGLDFWKWHRDISPLGYIPPLCTCKRTDGCMKMLYKYISNKNNIKDHLVCNNEVCRGLLYIPYSLLEIPLNRSISNGSEFVAKVQIPNCTDVYCGNMKHTIILCCINKEHEHKCLKAINDSNISPPLIYDVISTNFIPYFKKYSLNSYTNTPIMTVEPIDSDISDNDYDFGLGQIYAIKYKNNNMIINKFDVNLKKIIPLDTNLKFKWLSFNKNDDNEGTSDVTDDEKMVQQHP